MNEIKRRIIIYVIIGIVIFGLSLLVTGDLLFALMLIIPVGVGCAFALQVPIKEYTPKLQEKET